MTSHFHILDHFIDQVSLDHGGSVQLFLCVKKLSICLTNNCYQTRLFCLLSQTYANVGKFYSFQNEIPISIDVLLRYNFDQFLYFIQKSRDLRIPFRCSSQKRFDYQLWSWRWDTSKPSQYNSKPLGFTKYHGTIWRRCLLCSFRQCWSKNMDLGIFW